MSKSRQQRTTWEACYLPYEPSRPNPSRKGFKSEQSAWDYVMRYICSSCKEALKRGYEIIEYEKDGEKVEHRRDVTHPNQTACGCEWDVSEEE